MRENDRKIVFVMSKHFEVIENALKKINYNVIKISSIEEAALKSRLINPDIIIKDIDFGIDKFFALLRKNYILNCIPLIAIADDSNSVNFSYFYEYVDDFLKVPIDTCALVEKIKRFVSLSEKALIANPLTRLPGNIAIQKELQRRIDLNEEFAAYYIDIDNFKVFNDCYGYERGDRVIRFTADVVWQALENSGGVSKNSFAGHIGGDDFFAITDRACIEEFCSFLVSKFDSNIVKFYNEEDRKRGFLLGRNRKGETRVYPLMSVSIAVAVNYNGNLFSHFAEVSERCAEIKKYVKKFKKSMYMVDRRNWVPKRQFLLPVEEQADI